MGLTLMEQFRQWRAKPYILRVMTYDEANDLYELVDERVTKDAIPLEAVHVTGQSKTYCIDGIKEGKPPEGIDAISLNLYMKNNDISNALAVQWKSSDLDIKKIATYGIIAAVIVCVVYAMMR